MSPDHASRVTYRQRRGSGTPGPVHPAARFRISLARRSGNHVLFRLPEAICLFKSEMEAPGGMFT